MRENTLSPTSGSLIMPLSTLIIFCAAAWISGALFTYSFRDFPTGWTPFPRRKAAPKRKTGSYYFADDARPKRSRRWRSWVGWVSAVALSVALLGAGVIAAANFKSRPNAAAGYRPGNQR
jgi:hypothetical protein